jgi:low affinity Fe/Cu permease
MEKEDLAFVDKVTGWVGSPASVFLHTIVFAAAFAIGLFDYAPWDMVLLVLTTAVSLEAIYLAIFIQMTVNRHTKSLQEVEEDIDEIQEDVDEIQEDVDEIQEDVEEDNKLEEKEAATLESLARDMRSILSEIEELKKK